MTTEATQRLRLIGCLTLVMAPHVTRVPIWISLFAGVVLAWQALGTLRGWRPAGRLLRAGLAITAFAGVYVGFGQVNGQQAGVALLMLMLTLKLTETHRHRDVVVLLGLCYFVLITHFLFSQSIAMAGFLGLTAWLITACFLDANHPQSPLALRTALRGSAALILQAVPVAAVLFVLFPRIPGPLWGLPSDAGVNARSGLSDSMQPGSINQLALSDEVAFRVRFDGQPPPPEQRYWRGPVLWAFDGRRWTRGRLSRQYGAPQSNELRGEPLHYAVTLEPNRRNWLLALDLPASTPDNSAIGPAGSLYSQDKITERRLYRMTSYADYRLQLDPPRALLDYALRLPYTGNPRARELAQGWRKQGLSPEQIVDAALHRFTEQPFIYTLQPPPANGADNIDHFLFETRRGFCEHYASAFTFLMRAAGIPARVVTGYQGGESGALGGYLIVRSSDAHAWSEVWLAGRGWARVDPTAAVAPERIESGLSAAMAAGEPVPYMARHSGELLYQLQLGWDWVNASWDRWFLAYGPDLQNHFLSQIGLPDMRSMILALTGLLTAFLAVLGGVLLWQTRPRTTTDPAQAAWLRFCRRLERAGLRRRPQEGPMSFAERVTRAHPEWQLPVRRIVGLYIDLRYRDMRDTDAQHRLQRAVREFRPDTHKA